MRTYRKIISVFSLLTAASMLFTGCGAQSSGGSYTNQGPAAGNSSHYEYQDQADNGAGDCSENYIYDQELSVSNNEEYNSIVMPMSKRRLFHSQQKSFTIKRRLSQSPRR